MKFTFEIKETLSRLVTIEAATECEAYRQAKELYRREEIVLGADDCISTDIELFSDGDGDR